MREGFLVILGVVALIVVGVRLWNRGEAVVSSGSGETVGVNLGALKTPPDGEPQSEVSALSVMSTTDAAFDGLALSLAPGWKNTIANAKPFMAIVTNTSQRRVAAFSLCFLLRTNGPPTTACQQHRAPDALTNADERLRDDPNERELLPGESRLVGMGFAMHPLRPDVEPSMQPFIDDLQKRYRGYGLPLITVDSIIFDDGEIAGPDTVGLREHYSAAVAVKQTLYRTMIDAVKKGASFEEALAAGEREMIGSRGALPEELRFYADEALADVENSKRRQGSERTLAIIQKLLLEKTFEIRKPQPAH
jgi:hypothetical protein